MFATTKQVRAAVSKHLRNEVLHTYTDKVKSGSPEKRNLAWWIRGRPSDDVLASINAELSTTDSCVDHWLSDETHRAGGNHYLRATAVKI